MSAADRHVPLPVMNRVFDRTLCLVGYTLNQGQQQALAQAARYFKGLVSRVVLEQNGIRDSEFAEIVEGLRQADIRELCYRNDELGPKSVQELVRVVAKRIPDELQKLEIVGPKLRHTKITGLVSELQWSKLQVVKLVDCQIGSQEAEMLVNLVSRNKVLEEIDLSMNEQITEAVALPILHELVKHMKIKSVCFAGCPII